MNAHDMFILSLLKPYAVLTVFHWKFAVESVGLNPALSKKRPATLIISKTEPYVPFLNICTHSPLLSKLLQFKPENITFQHYLFSQCVCKRVRQESAPKSQPVHWFWTKTIQRNKCGEDGNWSTRRIGLIQDRLVTWEQNSSFANSRVFWRCS